MLNPDFNPNEKRKIVIHASDELLLYFKKSQQLKLLKLKASSLKRN